MTQLFRVELVPEGTEWRITLNDRPVGPLVPDAHGKAVFGWFMGYLEQNVTDTARRMGIASKHVVAAEHEVPGAGPCPDCGKSPGDLAEGVTENPCPRCRR